MPDCPHCGQAVPADARFCPECGRPAAEEPAATAVQPPAPPGRRRWPPDPFALIVALLAVGGIVLLAGSEWAWGLVVLLAAGVAFLSTREAERRAAGYALGGFGARFSASRGAWAARSRGQLDLFRVRRERAELEAERARSLQEFGRAVFEDDEAGREAGRAAVEAVSERIREKEAEIQTLIQATEERVQRAQASVKATEQIEAEAPPEPARVPEPWPPPDEGNPPSPAPVPEPSPGEPPPDPEHPPAPQTGAATKR